MIPFNYLLYLCMVTWIYMEVLDSDPDPYGIVETERRDHDE